ncbi:interleukin-21 receptor isoform X1 [Tiliqua scincoides]|uniref:interleukin-21 receptor isoform X1 n=1 Tax=Tiliqua scincoides TaxID=71010 RepID=UPI0034631CF5
MALQALLWLLLLQHTSACEDLACFADFVQTLTCLLGSGGAAPQGLAAEWNCGDGGACAFQPIARGAGRLEYSCFAEQSACAAINSFTVELRPRNGSGRGCRKRLSFSANFKPQPPFNLTVEASRDGYNVSWKTKYQRRRSHLDSELQYQLRYRHRGRPWQEQGQKKDLPDTWTLRLLPHELEGGLEYEVQVRVRPREQGDYQGTWSEWSSTARLRALPKAPEGGEGARWLVPLLLLLSLFTVAVVFRGCHQRLWKKLDVFIPSPAPFFQPLYLAHHGDFKEWLGASWARATLDTWEWGTVLPEVIRIGPGHQPLSPAKGGQVVPLETALPHLVGCQQAPQDSCGLEQSYGHLSINTVTVSGGPAGCCSHSGCAGVCLAVPEAAESQDAYRGVMDDDDDGDSSSEGQTPRGLLLQDVLLHSHSFPSGSESLERDSPPVLLQVGGSLGRKAEEGVSFFGWPLEPWDVDPPLCLSSPGEERLFYSNLLSPDGDVDGDAGTGLDLDTIDSGFADSDCASPVDCELGPGEGKGVREAFLPSYVKQWVSCHNRTPPS